GEVRMALSFGAPQEIGIGPIETFDGEAWFGEGSTLGDLAFQQAPSEDNGWTEVIDGMPAKLVVTKGTGAHSADEIRTWGVYDPQRFDSIWFVRTALRGPDIEGLRAQADEIAKSLHFDARPPVLDASRRDK